MTTTIIESNDKSINTTAKMLRIKAEFAKMGIKDFPRAYLESYCPYKQASKTYPWYTLAANVWRLRSSDNKVITAFEKGLIDAQDEIENANCIDPQEVK